MNQLLYVMRLVVVVPTTNRLPVGDARFSLGLSGLQTDNAVAFERGLA